LILADFKKSTYQNANSWIFDHEFGYMIYLKKLFKVTFRLATPINDLNSGSQTLFKPTKEV